jgi:hypothetical protein
MVITLDPPLPCADIIAGINVTRTSRSCGRPGTIGVISPTDADAWELLPLCNEHSQAYSICAPGASTHPDRTRAFTAHGIQRPS